MKKLTLSIFALVLTLGMFAQSSFEGSFTVSYKNEKGETVTAEIKAKGDNIRIKQTENGNKKYDYFLVNLKTRDFYTIAAGENKIAIKYNLDKILEFYESNKLKPGYVRNSNIGLKATDKTKEEAGVKLTQATADNAKLSATAWTSETTAPINELIPLLRVLGNWNEAQGTTQNIVSADVTSKEEDKKTTTVKVSVKKETITASFEVPKGYAVKDFAALMDDQKANKDINTIIQSFAQF